MNIRNVMHELGQTFVAGFEGNDIVRALPTEDADPDILPFADGIFVERLEEALEYAAWVDREYQEGRVTVIDAYLSVAV